jgi:hypothetical protein
VRVNLGICVSTKDGAMKAHSQFGCLANATGRMGARIVSEGGEEFGMPAPRKIRDILELEVFLFGGVPEIPDPVYGRDSFPRHDSRLTLSERESFERDSVVADDGECEVIAEYEIVVDDKGFEYRPISRPED